MKEPKISSKKNIDLAILMPIGPGLCLENVADTVESIECYIKSTKKLFIVDDSGTNQGDMLRDKYNEIEILTTSLPQFPESV